MKPKPPALQSILLVDDDHSNNFLNKIFINQLNLDVTVDIALNGEEALAHISDKVTTPCLVILDLQMPVMDGWEFLEAFHQSVPKKIKDLITIVVISVSGEKADVSKARKNPYVKHFIQKPVSDLKFRRLIQKYF
ncbi:response regulator [Aggregatimonas sangjinii]|uniref:response regulator n=1 Tax=Aggregatimonas sangjinii TaxID=2583587 RepID=UPI0015862231|nr:response regulator [Aggregatimonas sangjinii]